MTRPPSRPMIWTPAFAGVSGWWAGEICTESDHAEGHLTACDQGNGENSGSEAITVVIVRSSIEPPSRTVGFDG